MNTFTSITYTQSSQPNDSIEKLEYMSSIKGNDGKLMSTSYVNTIQNNQQQESFNKLLKNNNDLYEQIGNSRNRTDWDIKEFHNNILNKEYKDPYGKHNFDQALMDSLPSSSKTIDNPFLKIKNKLLNY